MDELISFCSESLRKGLIAGGPEMAALRVELALGQLHPRAEKVMRWRYGLGYLLHAPSEIAERLEVSAAEMEELWRCALLDFGFALLAVLADEADELAVAA